MYGLKYGAFWCSGVPWFHCWPVGAPQAGFWALERTPLAAGSPHAVWCDALGSSCVFPALHLEFIISPRSPGFFSWKWYLESIVWHLGVLVIYHCLNGPLFVADICYFCSVVRCVQLFATPWMTADQAPLSFTISWSLHRVHGVLLGRILEWFAIHCSSGPCFSRALHCDPSIVGGPAWHGS